jgi:tetratricopeptide (TPR) repeat protein
MPRVELSMIVKDGGPGLKRCLESVRGVVDRITIGDTGSTDDSAAIARSFGAEVIDVPWQQDFAQARNRVLSRSQCDWILVLDADEMLDASAAQTLREALQCKDVAAYDVWRWNYVLATHSRSGEQGAIANPCLVEAARPYPAYVKSLNTRLFRRHPEIYFTRPVHESVSPCVEALGLRKTVAKFVIHHFGQAEDPVAIRKGKNELYQEIGLAHLQSQPQDARTCFELGLGELEHFKRPQKALEYFVQALRLNPRSAAAYLFAGLCLVRLGRFTEALQLLGQSESLDPSSIVLQEAIGDAEFHQANYLQASVGYARAQSLGGASALIDAKLGACEVHLDRKQQGMTRVLRALEREPDFAELYGVASATALLAGRLDLAAEIEVRRLGLEGASATDFALAAALSRSLGSDARSRALLEQGLSLFPRDAELQRALLSHPS